MKPVESASATARVLLVDDDVELLELLRDYLEKDGFEVACVHDGNAGVAVDLGEIIEDVAEDARLEAAPKRCRIEVSLPETIEVSGSQELLHRAIENVVRNAVRHAPTDSAVDIAASIDAARRQVVIDITDSGGGVPESDLDAIFTPFFRVDNAGMSDGYGLGLAITRRIVAAHGGGITAANRSAGGLRVTLRLPVDKTAGRPIQA